MNSSGLFAELKKHPLIMVFVVLFHIALVVLLSINLSNDEKPPMPMAQKHKIIDAVVVDANQYDKREKQKKVAAKKKIEDKKKAEKKRLLEKKKVVEKKRLAEKKKVEEKEIAIAKKKKADKKAKEKKEKERKAREQQEKQRQQQAKLEAEKKRKIEEERQRRAEEEAEFKRALLEEEQREEAAKKQAEYAAKLQTLRQKYIILIAQKVENNWLRPVSNMEGQSCDVVVTQTMMGDVIDVQLQSCTNDNAFQRSVERAVRKASPLPLPPNPDVFDREIYFTFKPRL
ncbi:MAG: cell envelope integrity protein TolA [Gammaproteobacteria bacterium]|nr:cell envelope integrity protein TolA [Gammaproteobacteria bacterium]